MNLIAYGEIRYLTGDVSLFARFARPDGGTFDMPLSEAQFVSLVQAADGNASSPATAPTAYGGPAEEIDDDTPLRLAAGPRYRDDGDEDDL